MKLHRLLTIVAALTCAACSDTPADSTPDKNNLSADMGAGDMITDMIAGDMTAGRKPDGAACAANQECASGACLADGGTCGTSGGPVCGARTCGADQRCGAGDVCAPACATVVCATSAGEVCCAAEEACLFAACVALGAACDDAAPCPRGQFCEPTAGRCVDRNADPNACVYVPPAESFTPVEGFAWTGSPSSPASDQVMMAPMVANLTDDNNDGKIDLADIPDIVFVTFTGSAYVGDGVIRVISGADGAEHWDSAALAAPVFAYGGTIPALADIDGDGVVEIIISAATSAGGGIYALEHDGATRTRPATARAAPRSPTSTARGSPRS
jgi:hypothetical protein